MRFEVRFNNEVWHVFDVVKYKAVEAYHKTEFELAMVRANKLNSRK